MEKKIGKKVFNQSEKNIDQIEEKIKQFDENESKFKPFIFK